MAKQSSIYIGSILILVGLFLLAAQFLDIGLARQWPLIVVVVGALLLLAAVTGRRPVLAVPGSLFVGLGGLLYYQSLTGRWGTWAYAWTLLPGFIGVGVVVMHLLAGRPGRARHHGGLLIGLSLALFFVFGSFLGGWISFGLLWPLAIILLGLWLLARNFRRE